MLLEEAIEHVQTSDADVLIPCTSIENQASIRAMLFKLRKKKCLSGDVSIGISNFAYGSQLFVKVYKRTNEIFFTTNDKGIPVPIVENKSPLDKAENARQVTLMRRDGMSDEDIIEALAE